MVNFSPNNYQYYYGKNNTGVFPTGFRNNPQNYYAVNPCVTQPDTVYISPENRVHKEKKLTKTQKLMLGIGAAATVLIGSIIGHKIINKPVKKVVQDNMSEVFRRKLTNEESGKIAKQYQEIFKINNCEDFCNKMFNQVKKDYGYGSVNIPFDIVHSGKNSIQYGAWSSSEGKMRLMTKFSKGASLPMKEKKRIFETYIHEFQHVKQTEMAYRADKDSYIDALKEAFNKNNSKEKLTQRAKEILQNRTKLEEYAQKTGNSVETSRKLLEEALNAKPGSVIEIKTPEFQEAEIRRRYESWFGNMPKIQAGTEEYNLAKQYIENERNYIPSAVNQRAYRKQIREEEAYKAGEKGKKMLKYLVNA